MSQQQQQNVAGRTPTTVSLGSISAHKTGRAYKVTVRDVHAQILRKRAANKENEDREVRRNKLRGRRVSFAPEDGLETMHLYDKVSCAPFCRWLAASGTKSRRLGFLTAANAALPHACAQDKVNQGRQERLDDTDDLLAGGISTAVPYGASGLPMMDPDSGAVPESPAPGLGGPPASPTHTTPLSMDLTNHLSLQSLQGGSGRKQPRSASKAAANPRPSPRKSPRRSQAPSSSSQPDDPPAVAAGNGGSGGSQEFTRNITMSVPALSTLVEEDEDGMMMMMMLESGCKGGSQPGEASPYDMLLESGCKGDSHGGSSAMASPYDGMLSPEVFTGPVPEHGESYALRHMCVRCPWPALNLSPPTSLPLQAVPPWRPPGSDPPLLLAGGASMAAPSPQGGFLSPISPYVLNEMRLGGNAATPGAEAAGVPEDTEDLKEKWGFTPGAEDTLDASHGVFQCWCIGWMGLPRVAWPQCCLAWRVLPLD